MSPVNLLISVDAYEPKLRDIRSLVPTDSAIDIVSSTQCTETLPTELLRDKQILFCESPPANFQDLTNLKWIQLASVGYSQLYGLSLPEKGIRVTNARGVFDAPIAEWCIAMMINLARDLPTMLRNQRCHYWDRNPRFQSEIRGATLGIYGYGGIGRETARLAKCMGLDVWVLTRGKPQRREGIYRVPGTGDHEGILPDRIFFPEQKFDFLAGLDYLLLAMPLTPLTRGIIGREELAALPRSACILNPARGPLIQETPLLDSLQSEKIRGAALDTHYQYPLPSDHPLWAMHNVILTPHISGSSGSPNFLSRIWEIFAENIKRFINHEPLINEVAPQDLAEA